MSLRYDHDAILQREHRGPILVLAFNSDALLLACGSLDGVLTIWSRKSAELLVVISANYDQDCAFLSASWIPGKSNMLLCGMESGQLIYIRIENDYVSASGYSAHRLPVECLSFCETQKLIATGSFQEVKIWCYRLENDIDWDLETTLGLPPSLGENRDAEVIVTSLMWATTKYGCGLLLVTYLHHGVVFWDIGSETERNLNCLSILSFAASASISPDHRYIAISNLTTGFDIYDIATKSPLRGFSHGTFPPSFSPVSFVHDGFALLGGTSGGVARIWDITTGYSIEPLMHKENDTIWALAAYSDVSSDGIFIATSAKASNRLPYVVIWRAKDIYEQRHVHKPISTKSKLKYDPCYPLIFVTAFVVGIGFAIGLGSTIGSTALTV